MTLKPLLFCAVVCGALLSPVHAQTTPNTAQKSGYELLVKAGTLLLPGPNGGADSIEPSPSPIENLRRERLAVARNAPALALVREAIRAGVSIPTPNSDTLPFSFYARNRELARQFSQESDVRFADGDFVGALNSKLDAMELGAVVGRGSLISGFPGTAIEAIAISSRKLDPAHIDLIVPHLDAKECREAAARLERIEGRRATAEQILRDEEKSTLALETTELTSFQAEKNPKPDDKGEFPTAEDIAQLKALTPEKLAQDNARFFDALAADASLPYSTTPPKLPPANELNPWTRGKYLWANDPNIRLSFARPVAQNRLLRAALELRAQKLERGAYPNTFQTPIDPFSPASQPLVYRRTATGYLLYSVGPDGVDNGGKAVRGRLQPTSRGDLVQTPF